MKNPQQKPRALVKIPSSLFAQGLTSQKNAPPDLGECLRQHADYRSALEHLGFALTILAPDDLPDSCFVEDMAVVGAAENSTGFLLATRSEVRLGEQPAVLKALHELLPAFTKVRIQAPGNLDGGDVLQVGRRFFVGLSARTNRHGFEQFQKIVFQHGFTAVAIEVEGMLHLKTGVSRLDEQTVLALPTLAPIFSRLGFRVVPVDPQDAHAANALAVNRKVLLPSGYPRVSQALRNHAFEPVEVDLGEFKKQDGGASCLSILLP